MIKNKLYSIALLMLVLTIAVTGCGGGSGGGGGDTTKKPVDQATGQKLTSITASQGLVNSAIFSLVAVNFYNPTNPSTPKPGGAPAPPPAPQSSITSQSLKGIQSQGLPDGFNDWFGPDSEGWYWRSYKWGYGDDSITEYARSLKPPEVGREYKSTYVMGSDATGKTTIDIYAKTAVKDGLLTGEYDIKNSSYGYSSIGTVEYKFLYRDYDPNTGAGIFEWWGGGDINSLFPYKRFLTIVATDNGDGETIHVKVSWNFTDSGSGIPDWEYDCPYHPVEIPDITWL